MIIAKIIRIIMILFAVFLLVKNIVQLGKRKTTGKVCLSWSLFSVLLIIFSTVPALYGWSEYLTERNCVSVLILFFVCVIWSYRIHRDLSVLQRKNQELAMHVSLLNQENETLISEIKKFKELEKDKDDEQNQSNQVQ